MSLAAYFDASGHESDQKVLVVAGFVSSAEHWIEFDRLWVERLKSDGITCFHAVDYEHSSKEFKGWRSQHKRRRELREDLMEILKSHVFRKFSEVVIVKALQQNMTKETKRQYHVNAYSLAGRACVAGLREWLDQEQWKTNAELVFESGDIGKGLLMNELARDGFPAPIFKPKRDRKLKNGSIELGVSPLQAADWLAYETFVMSSYFEEHKQMLNRPAMDEFNTTPGIAGIFTFDDIARLEEVFRASSDRILKPGKWATHIYG